MILAAALLLSGPAEPQAGPPPPASVVVATPGKPVWLNEPSCPPEDICMRYPARVGFRRVRVVSGAPVPARFDGRIWLHAGFAKGVRLVMLVEPAAGGSFEVRSWTVANGKGVACFPADLVDKLDLLLPGRKPNGDSGVCFRP